MRGRVPCAEVVKKYTLPHALPLRQALTSTSTKGADDENHHSNVYAGNRSFARVAAAGL